MTRHIRKITWMKGKGEGREGKGSGKLQPQRL